MKIAPEWYKDLPSHNSWTNCLIQFITNPRLGPFARVKRGGVPAVEAAANYDKDD
jgi:sphingolipid delta-4 desaturase